MAEKEKGKIHIIREGINREDDEDRQKKNPAKRAAVFYTVLMVVCALAFAFWNREFQSYEEVTSTPNSEANDTRFVLYRGDYLKYSKDGISYLDQKEKIIWTEAYNMEKPKISVQGEYAVVADLGGNQIQLFDKDGKIGEYSMPYPVKNVQAAAQGVFCVVLMEEGSSYIRLYNRDGKLLTDIKSQLESNGYPLAVSISSDGMKMAVSYYFVDGMKSKNILSFYNFGEGGKGQSGNLVGTYQFEDTLIPKVMFMDDDTICAVGDNQTLFFQMDVKPKKIRKIEFEREIKSVFSSSQYIGFIYENDQEVVERGDASPYQVSIYKKNGRLKTDFGIETLYEENILIDDILYSYTGSACSLRTLKGIEFFQNDMGQNIIDILPTNKRRDFLFVYGDRSAKVHLKNTFHKKTDLNEEQNTQG